MNINTHIQKVYPELIKMGKTKLNIVVSCVSNKTKTPLPSLQFRNIELDNIPKMGEKWINFLKASNAPLTPAYQLYSGAAWNSILDAEELSKNLKNYEVNWYIMSVGYGLLKWEEPIKPYSITFSKPSFDGLRKRVLKQEANRLWWDYIINRRNFKISDIATPDFTTIVVGSTEYINAVREDLEGCNNLLIISSTYNARYFVDRQIQTHEKLRFIVGGGKIDNNARNLKFILHHIDQWGVDLDVINTNLKGIISGIKEELPKVNRNRKSLSKDKAINIIKSIGLNKPMSHYVNTIRNERGYKISEQVIISYLQELKK